jgi:beta-lactamase class A
VTPVTVVDPNAPLQELLDRLVAAKGDYAIAAAEPDGRRANANGDKQYTAASTYKLFIAYGVFQQVNSGELQWTDIVMPGRNAGECLRLMIVRSDNDCPEAFGNLIGWQNIDAMMDGLGLHTTQVKFHDNATTANDLALYLSKLLDGSLLNQADTQTLLGYMKEQIYRRGIPAGTGVTVADKVGFLDALLHDAGIVYGQKGPYVLVIMSDGSTWSELADAAKQVHNLIEQ